MLVILQQMMIIYVKSQIKTNFPYVQNCHFTTETKWQMIIYVQYPSTTDQNMDKCVSWAITIMQKNKILVQKD